MTSIVFLVNTPRRLEMINLARRHAQNRQIELLSLSGTILVDFSETSQNTQISLAFRLHNEFQNGLGLDG